MSFFSCLSLSDDEENGFSSSLSISSGPKSGIKAAVPVRSIQKQVLVNGLVLTKDEIISLINDFDLDPHSHHISRSLIISSKCADYRPAKAILLCVCHQALTLLGKIPDHLVCKSIVEVLKFHSKKPSILMLTYASVISLLLDESNQTQFVEDGLHRFLSSTVHYEIMCWKYDEKNRLDTSKMSLCCWRIVIIAILTANNLQTRRIFGESFLCELTVQVLEQLFLLSKDLSLSSPCLSFSSLQSSRHSSSHPLPPISLLNLVNIFVTSSCVALIHLSKDYLTNYQRIISIPIQHTKTFLSFLEDNLRPSLRMQYSILSDDTWTTLLLTKDYFTTTLRFSSSENLPSSPDLSFPQPPLSPPPSPHSCQSLHAVQAISRRFSSTHPFFHSMVSTVSQLSFLCLSLLHHPVDVDRHHQLPSRS
jgi:hypothetical protein